LNGNQVVNKILDLMFDHLETREDAIHMARALYICMCKAHGVSKELALVDLKETWEDFLEVLEDKEDCGLE